MNIEERVQSITDDLRGINDFSHLLKIADIEKINGVMERIEYAILELNEIQDDCYHS